MLLITYLWVGLYVDILSVYQTKLGLHNGATALRGARVHGYSRGMEVNVCQGRTRGGRSWLVPVVVDLKLNLQLFKLITEGQQIDRLLVY